MRGVSERQRVGALALIGRYFGVDGEAAVASSRINE